MQVPTRITFSGDKESAKQFIRRGRKELFVLENLMRLKKHTQGSRTVQPFPGVVIECFSVYNLRQVNIYVAPSGGEAEEQARECFCTTCFAIGSIVNVYQGNGNSGSAPTCTYYDVEVCQKDKYVLFESVKPVDMAVYVTGQLVMVGYELDSEMESCCPQDAVSMCSLSGVPVILPICLAMEDQYAMWRWKRVSA